MIHKIVNAAKQGRLVPAARKHLHPYVSGIRHSIVNPAAKRIAIHCPDYVQPDLGERPLVERLFTAFQKMKDDQKGKPAHYLPSSMWQTQLNETYSYLIEGLAQNDIEKFHFFLANFGTWKQYHGIESTTFIHQHAKSALGQRYLENDVFLRQLNVWQWFYNNRKDVKSLTYPQTGNQSGAIIDGNFVGLGSFFNEIIASNLINLISDLKRPVIADLGAGYGKLAYFTLRDIPDFAFLDFDLPEVLTLASYYMIKAFPQKKSLLYGEGTFDAEAMAEYDLIFMPSFMIEQLPNKSIDLFINKNSLGEMSRASVEAYIKHMTRSTRFLFHMNHDNIPNLYHNNERGLLGYEYPIPKDFRLLFRYPDIGHLLYQGWLDLEMDIFLYLYERK